MSLFDIFGKTWNNSLDWLEAAESLKKAKERLAELRLKTRRDYGVFDSLQGLWVIPFRNK